MGNAHRDGRIRRSLALVALCVGVLALCAPAAWAGVTQAPAGAPGGATGGSAPSSTAEPGQGGATAVTTAVDVVKVDGLLDPVMVEFIRTSIAKAQNDGAIAVVLTIDSEGAVVPDSELAALVQTMRTSKVPVDIWVGPSNSSAIDKAAYLLAGARTIGVAPGARIGGAPPSSQASSANDGPSLNAYANEIASLRESRIYFNPPRIIGFQEAKDLGITKADAATVLEFLATVPGFEMKEVTVDGKTTRQPVTQVRFTQLDLVHQLFHAVAGPSSAYLLITIGLALLIFELFTAGVGVAGIVGATAFVFGAYGMVTLPTHTVSLALLVGAFVALAVDVQTGVPRFWTGVGLTMYVVGSVTLFDGVSMSWITLVAGIGGMLLAFLSGMPSMVRTRFSTPTIGREWMVGEMGRAITAVNPDGVVQIQGAMWRAFTNRATPIEELDKVRVIGIEGLVLEVEPEEGGAKDYRDRGPKEARGSRSESETADP